MSFKTLIFASNVVLVASGSAALAENKFLAQPAAQAAAVTSCSAPKGMIAFVSNILANDAYLARAEPSIEGDYLFSYFGLETQAFLTQDFMTTTDPATAEICGQIDQGIDTPELQQQLLDAIDADLLWWPIEANMDLGYQAEGYVDRSRERVQEIAYISAKHIAFATPEKWAEMIAPNDLGYLSLGDRAKPVPIISIEGRDTENAHAVATRTKDALDYCVLGYGASLMYTVFHPSGAEVGYHDSPDSVALPANQTELVIEDGVWSGCRVGDPDDEFTARSADARLEFRANCPAMTIDGFEVDSSYLPYSSGAAGGLGTNFAILCPQTTRQVLQDACDNFGGYVCDKLADFTKR